MLTILSDILAPHYCCSCGEIGVVLCEYCKFDIVSQPFDRCIVCLGLSADGTALCKRCQCVFTRAWCVSERVGALERLIDNYKFDHVSAAVYPLVLMLDEILPEFAGVPTIVPVPTIARHVRQRGYDHVAKLAALLARRRHLPYRSILERRTNTVQHEATKRQRRKQASEAFMAREKLDGGVYLLIDDIYTTGATVEFAARTLREAGAAEVWVAVLARQPIEK